MNRHDLPELPGVLRADEIARSAAYLLHAQEPSGAIPWFPGGHLDVWDHIECAMALSTVGHYTAAVRAYDWLAAVQHPDGSWPAKLRQGTVVNPLREANHASYLAVGVWHHFLVTGDDAFLERLWPTVRAGIGFVLGLRTERGEILWARDADGSPGDHALLTACASIHHALRCAIALADHLDHPQPDYSMDWYYPILGGAMRGARAEKRIAERWDTFVVPGLGIRCVSDQPWVTGAETSELVLALAAIGSRDRGAELLASIQHLRDPDDGAYWTGYQFVEDVRWPVERSTWTTAAVILAVDALCGATPGSQVFTRIPRAAEQSAEGCCDQPVVLPAEAGLA